MIVEAEVFARLTPGSNKKVLCRCDTCGTERMVFRLNLKAGYRQCNKCSFAKNRCRSRSVSDAERERRRLEFAGAGNPKWNPDRVLVANTARARKAMYSMLSKLLFRTGQKKHSRSEVLLGYGPHKLRTHLEDLFVDGMSWANYGLWHIDHITPVKWFLVHGIEDAAVVNALANLQPLWAADNLSKGSKVS